MLNTNVLFDPLRLLFQTSSKAVLNFSPCHLVIYRAQLLQWCRGYYKLTTVLGPGCRCTTKYPSKLGNVVGSPGSFSVHYISPCILRYSEPTSFQPIKRSDLLVSILIKGLFGGPGRAIVAFDQLSSHSRDLLNTSLLPILNGYCSSLRVVY